MWYRLKFKDGFHSVSANLKGSRYKFVDGGFPYMSGCGIQLRTEDIIHDSETDNPSEAHKCTKCCQWKMIQEKGK